MTPFTTPFLSLSRALWLGFAGWTLVVSPPAAATAADASRWIASWTASPQRTWGPEFAFPTNLPPVLQNQTIRQSARISVGGRRVRVVLSNAYGSAPLRIGAAHIVLAGSGRGQPSGEGHTLTFGGQSSTVMLPGAPLVSDPVGLEVAPLASLMVSVFVPGNMPVATFHWDGRQTGWLAAGNQVAAKQLQAASATTARILLSAIEVEAAPAPQAVIVMGDSITDGNGASMDSNTRWPDFLAARLAMRNVAVLNAGISGARLLGDRMGDNALARLDRDVLSQPHAKTLVLLLGINDISWPGTLFEPQGMRPTAADMVTGYRQIITRAHSRGLKVVGATLTPFEGALSGTPLADYYHPDKDALRQQVNAWIRNSGEFDAVLDFDLLLRDPEHPSRLRAAYDSGDRLHPGDAGNRAMAEAIDLEKLFLDQKGPF